MSSISQAGVLQSFEVTQITGMHGSHSSSLHFMVKAEGKNKNCLVPLARLAGLTFSGELNRSFSQQYTRNYSFWGPNTDMGLFQAKRYTDTGVFNLERAIVEFKQTIELYRPESWSLPYGDKEAVSTWEQTDYKIKRIRAFDEARFQKELATPLKDFLGRILVDVEVRGSRKETTEKIRAIIESLQNPPSFQLSEEDKKQIADAYPLIFLTNVTDFNSENANENKMARNMELGKDIPWIATAEQNIQRLSAYLDQANLSHKVSVVSLESLG